MIKKTLIPVIILLCLYPITVSAQSIYGQDDGDVAQMMQSPEYKNSNRTGILGLDLSKLEINHSYSMFFSTFGNNSFTQGMYLNTISYQFSMPLSMKLQWGVTHQPFGQGFQNSNIGNQFFISGAELRFEPKENMVFKLQFRQIPAGAYYNSPYTRMNQWNQLNRFYHDPLWDIDD